MKREIIYRKQDTELGPQGRRVLLYAASILFAVYLCYDLSHPNGDAMARALGWLPFSSLLFYALADFYRGKPRLRLLFHVLMIAPWMPWLVYLLFLVLARH